MTSWLSSIHCTFARPPDGYQTDQADQVLKYLNEAQENCVRCQKALRRIMTALQIS